MFWCVRLRDNRLLLQPLRGLRVTWRRTWYWNWFADVCASIHDGAEWHTGNTSRSARLMPGVKYWLFTQECLKVRPTLFRSFYASHINASQSSHSLGAGTCIDSMDSLCCTGIATCTRSKPGTRECNRQLYHSWRQSQHICSFSDKYYERAPEK